MVIQTKGHHLIEPEHSPKGFLFTDRDDAFSWVKFSFGALWLLIWCGISFPIFIISLFTMIAKPALGTLFLLLFISIFAVIGVIGLAWGIRLLLVILRLEPGQVVLSSYPLHLGESITIHYRRRLRQGYTPQTGRLTARWLCYEWVQYRRGTDIETKTHTLWETDLPEASIESGTKTIEYEAQVTVSPEYPPSFDARNNQVRWELQVKLKLPGVAKDTSYFRFNVLPQVIQ